MKILTVFGTRPEVIKMAPVIQELEKYPQKFLSRICVTGQHRHLVDPLLKLFNIKPDYDLNIMQENQSLEYVFMTVLNKLGKIIKKEKPDYLIIQGDTTTAMAASLAAFSQKIKIAHIEAGLRTYNKLNPYPEEVNRRIIDSLADLFFVHTRQAGQNLVCEGVLRENIELTGNPVIDALLFISKRKFNLKETVLEKIPFDEKKIILLTAHRRENFGQPLENVCRAVLEIARRCPQVYFVYPVHLNPNVQKVVCSILKDKENILLTKPLDYHYFIHLIKRSYLILTDSGGLQEEAPTLGKPVLVLRKITERPELLAAGAAELVGTQTEKIVKKSLELLGNEKKYQEMSRAKNPYGDGKAAKRIVGRFLKEIKNEENFTQS